MFSLFRSPIWCKSFCCPQSLFFSLFKACPQFLIMSIFTIKPMWLLDTSPPLPLVLPSITFSLIALSFLLPLGGGWWNGVHVRAENATFNFLNFIGFRVKILILKNCWRALKKGKNTLWGRQSIFSPFQNFSHPVQNCFDPVTWTGPCGKSRMDLYKYSLSNRWIHKWVILSTLFYY